MEQAPFINRTSKYRICDYSDTDYKQDFWDKQNHDYEDYVERLALRQLIAGCSGKCIEIGAGYGRLVDEYAGCFDQVWLLDYAPNLLHQAQTRIEELQLDHVRVIRGDLYQLTSLKARFDCAVCVRVLHHVECVPDYFFQVNSVLHPGGTFILEYANKRHLLEIIRSLLGLANIKPFSYCPSQRGNTVYYNFHPDYIKDALQQNGFVIEQELSVSLFRNDFIKWLFPYRLLGRVERLLQKPLGRFKPGPSVFIKARKTSETWHPGKGLME
jgi:2-polyprenyl-3-methyl-5-hydroxy-6-metoxy-1,4-benzoquinol methylase